ncbi:hypothetical protein [Prosthecobacter algae]|uniref:hypothetical protein n=1 Tax=Prosthecobacter algae TaxID=1144682 RepID=UPI0031EC8434
MSGARPARFHLWVAVAAGAVVAVFVSTWLALAPEEPAPPVVAKKTKPIRPPADPLPPVIAPRVSAPPDPMSIDPEIQKMADDLSAKVHSPARDLELVDEFLDLYRRVFQQGNPIGLNEDITAVLTGRNARNGILFPPASPLIVKGQLVDRWGTPYWFHPNSSYQMEIRSAGPDKNLFTQDDVVKNPGPDNMGIGVGISQP